MDLPTAFSSASVVISLIAVAAAISAARTMRRDSARSYSQQSKEGHLGGLIIRDTRDNTGQRRLSLKVVAGGQVAEVSNIYFRVTYVWRRENAPWLLVNRDAFGFILSLDPAPPFAGSCTWTGPGLPTLVQPYTSADWSIAGPSDGLDGTLRIVGIVYSSAGGRQESLPYVRGDKKLAEKAQRREAHVHKTGVRHERFMQRFGINVGGPFDPGRWVEAERLPLELRQWLRAMQSVNSPNTSGSRLRTRALEPLPPAPVEAKRRPQRRLPPRWRPRS